MAAAKENLKLSKGRGQKGSTKSTNLNEAVDTRKTVAEKAGVAEDTIRKAEPKNMVCQFGRCNWDRL